MSETDVEMKVERFVTVLVTQLAKKIERHVDRYLRRVAQIGVHEWRLLVHIYEFKTERLADIALAMNYDVGHVENMARGLAEKYYARFLQGPDGPGLTATTIGEGIYKTVLPHMREHHRQLTAVLDASQLSELQSLLGKLSAHVDTLLEEQRRHVR